ncbi:DUF4124 domain-containing protein [Variovorax sp. OV329]|uniref:DUF4124 domain-containing protein n=1 Tax=Variovorax sp. OV329 TaxID=1882825 RepID=UPI0008EB67FC|nr:DUF4124 domain-containing protein [Variovorax sp. OV329]SFM21237.1 protein of unknown function [Variovorax sp. OV329]
MHFVRISRAALVLALGAASFVASAQIHRCKDDKGQTILSDRPCATADAAVQQGSSGSNAGAVDRIAAPQMVNVRMRDMSAQYDFIPDQATRSTAGSRPGK